MFDETLQSEAEHCLWFDDFNDDDEEPLFDEEENDEEQDDDQEEEDDEGQPAPRLIQFRCSPVCRFSPIIRMLVRRYSDQINELLNVWGGALVDSQYVCAPYPSFRRFRSRRERIFYAGCLSAEGELEAVVDELRREHARLRADMLAVTGDSPRMDFHRVEHHLRDYRILVALAGCHREHVFHWWESTLGRLRQSDMVLQFYRARDAMRSRDPRERKAAKGRDAKRRKTKHRQEYLAEFEARPEVRAQRAEKKRAARAAAREQKVAREQAALGPMSSHVASRSRPPPTTPFDGIASQRHGVDDERGNRPATCAVDADGAVRTEVHAA